MTDVLKQGVNCIISANSIIDATSGNQLNVTGYTVYAVARPRYEHGGPYGYRMGSLGYGYGLGYWLGPIIAEWSTVPAGTQGLATTAELFIDQVRLYVTPSQTSFWRCHRVHIQADLTNPTTGYVARIIDEYYDINRDVTLNWVE